MEKNLQMMLGMPMTHEHMDQRIYIDMDQSGPLPQGQQSILSRMYLFCDGLWFVRSFHMDSINPLQQW